WLFATRQCGDEIGGRLTRHLGGILRGDVAVRDWRRQCGNSGNASLRGRYSTLAERPAVRRFLCAGAADARAEPDHRDLDRLPRRRDCRRGGGDIGNVRPDIGAGLFRWARLAAFHRRRLAWRAQPRPHSGHDRADGATVIVSVSVTDYNCVAAAITLATAAIALFMRVHPLWVFAIAAL